MKKTIMISFGVCFTIIVGFTSMIIVHRNQRHARFLEAIAQGDYAYQEGRYQEALTAYKAAHQTRETPETEQRIRLAEYALQDQQSAQNIQEQQIPHDAASAHLSEKESEQAFPPDHRTSTLENVSQNGTTPQAPAREYGTTLHSFPTPSTPIHREQRLPFVNAIREGNVQDVNSWIEEGIDANMVIGPYEMTPLMLAAIGRTQFDTMTVEKQQQYTTKSANLLMLAEMGAKSDRLEEIFGIRKEEQRRYAKIATLLLESGSNVQTQDSAGRTVFELALTTYNLEVAQLVFPYVGTICYIWSDDDGTNYAKIEPEQMDVFTGLPRFKIKVLDVIGGDGVRVSGTRKIYFAGYSYWTEYSFIKKFSADQCLSDK